MPERNDPAVILKTIEAYEQTIEVARTTAGAQERVDVAALLINSVIIGEGLALIARALLVTAASIDNIDNITVDVRS